MATNENGIPGYPDRVPSANINRPGQPYSRPSQMPGGQAGRLPQNPGFGVPNPPQGGPGPSANINQPNRLGQPYQRPGQMPNGPGPNANMNPPNRLGQPYTQPQGMPGPSANMNPPSRLGQPYQRPQGMPGGQPQRMPQNPGFNTPRPQPGMPQSPNPMPNQPYQPQTGQNMNFHNNTPGQWAGQIRRYNPNNGNEGIGSGGSRPINRSGAMGGRLGRKKY